MADITTTLEFLGSSQNAQAVIDGLIASLQRLKAETAGIIGAATKAGEGYSQTFAKARQAATAAAASEDRAAKAALAHAAAVARLRVAQGDQAGAVKVLEQALARQSERTTAVVRAETQLIGIKAQLTAASGKAERAMLQEAQAMARLQQIAGNTPAAIKTLEQALTKVTNPQSLAALRAQLQKTYLDTGYANSPLISAIRKTEEAIIREAQALARLQVARGDSAGAARTLETALGRVTQETNASVAAQTQLIQIQKNASTTAQDLSRSLQGVGFALTAGITAPLVALSAASVQSAKDIDSQVNVLRAFTGSAEAAEARIAKLIDTAQRTPGLTTRLAATLDAQLRVARVTEETIDRILPAVGRLNAISPLGDPERFARNLVQLVTQNFEKIDLKELVGQSPFAGELIKSIFNVDNPINAEAIRASAQNLGLTTTDAFFSAFADAAARDSRLNSVGESLATQFEKLKDRVQIALRPLGLAIIESLAPVVESIVPIIERIASAFASLPRPAQQAIIALAGIAAALGPLLIILAGAAQAVVVFAEAWGILSAALATGGALAALPALLNPVTLAIAAIVAALGVGALAWASYETAADRAGRLSVQQISAQQNEITQLRQLSREAEALAGSTQLTAEEKDRLRAIIERLDPQTRTYIESIQDERVAVSELNRILQQQISLKNEGLSRNLGDIGDATADLAIKISRARQELDLLTRQSREFAESGGKKAPALIPDEFGRELSVGPRSVEAFGTAIDEAKKKITGAEEAIRSFGAEIAAYINLNDLTVEGFRAQQIALGRSEDQVRAMIIAFNSFNDSQARAASQNATTTRTIDDQRLAVEALTASLEKLNKAANVEVDKRIREIALSARNAAEAKAALKQALALDDDFYAAVQNRTKVEKNLSALNEALNPRERSGGASAARRRATELRREAGAELDLLKQREKELEQSTRRETEQLRVAFEDRLVGQREYTERAIALDEELLAAKLETLREEEATAIRTARSKTEAEARQNEIRLRANQAVLDSEQRQADLRRQQRIAEERAAIEHEQRLSDIRDIARKSQEEAIRRASQEGRIGAVEGERELIRLERQRFAEREAQLRREAEAAGENEAERQKSQDLLRRLAEERAAFEIDASLRVQEALRTEAERFRDFVRDRVDALADLRRAQLAAAESQRSLAVQRGTLSQGRAELDALNARREALRLESIERERSIEAQAANLTRSAQLAGLGSAAILDIERQKNEALKAERARLYAELEGLDLQYSATEQRIAGGFRGLFSQRANELMESLGTIKGLVANFAEEIEQTITPLDEIGRNAFEGFAEGIGQTVSNFVLLGKTGPAVIRRLLAEQLAAIAKEAAVNSIKELALGFATLFLNPAESAGHFTSAALWAGLAGGAALVGRAVAPAQTGGGGGAAGDSGPSSGGDRIIEQGGPLRNQAPVVVVIRAEVQEGVIVRQVVNDFKNNGPTREALRRDLVNGG